MYMHCYTICIADNSGSSETWYKDLLMHKKLDYQYFMSQCKSLHNHIYNESWVDNPLLDTNWYRQSSFVLEAWPDCPFLFEASPNDGMLPKWIIAIQKIWVGQKFLPKLMSTSTI